MRRRSGVGRDDDGGGGLRGGGPRLRDLAPVDVGVARVVTASAATECRVVVTPVVALVFAQAGFGADVVVALACSREDVRRGLVVTMFGKGGM